MRMRWLLYEMPPIHTRKVKDACSMVNQRANREAKAIRRENQPRHCTIDSGVRRLAFTNIIQDVGFYF